MQSNAASLEQGMARHTYAYRVFIRNLDPFKFPYPSPQVTRTLEPLYSGHGPDLPTLLGSPGFSLDLATCPGVLLMHFFLLGKQSLT